MVLNEKRIRNINPVTGYFLTLLKKKGNERNIDHKIYAVLKYNVI